MTSTALDPLVYRLRQRIDQLTDQRDTALARLDASEAKLYASRQERKRLQDRLVIVKRSRDRWKAQARAARR